MASVVLQLQARCVPACLACPLPFAVAYMPACPPPARRRRPRPPPRPPARAPPPPPPGPPSLQALLSLVGATACVTFSYIFPGLLVLRCQRAALPRAGARGMIALGAVMAAIALYNRLAGGGGE